MIRVVIPIRAFADAKSRLSDHLDESSRARLMQTMAERVVDAARPYPTAIVSSAPEVVAWARSRGVAVLDDPGSLNEAADRGRAWAADAGATRVIVAHADLPLVESLEALAIPGSAPVAVVVPCHRDDGTPVLSVPIGAQFRFRYGPGSFQHHVEEGRRAGLDVTILRDDESLRRDVDSVEDLQWLP